MKTFLLDNEAVAHADVNSAFNIVQRQAGVKQSLQDRDCGEGSTGAPASGSGFECNPTARTPCALAKGVCQSTAKSKRIPLYQELEKLFYIHMDKGFAEFEQHDDNQHQAGLIKNSVLNSWMQYALKRYMSTKERKYELV